MDLKIHSVVAIPLTAPMQEGTRTAQRSFAEVSMVLVEVHTADGITGYGECLGRFGARAYASFINEVLVPLNTLIGDAWMRGQLEVFEEHAYTEVQQIVLRSALATLPDPGIAHPRVLLTTFPGEPHGQGLLLAEAMFAIDGARCTSLGPQTPIWDIARAAHAFRSDVIGLGFSGCMSPNQVVDSLTELRRKTPSSVAIWAGGSAPVLFRRPVEGVKALAGLCDIHAALKAWHLGER